MKQSICLVTGWAVGTVPLENLAKQLTVLGYEIKLLDLPYLVDATQWLASLAKQLPEKSYWIGWSLGGQLLSQATQYYSEQCLGLITLASNTCFKAKADWPTAMEEDIFLSFQQNYMQAPKQTIKRFLQLVAQGGTDTRHLVRQLQQGLVDNSTAQANAGLELLAELDTRQALRQFKEPQYHLLAEFDALVPSNCSKALLNLLPEASVELLENTGHAFPVQLYPLVAEKVDQFIKANL
ncbi:alpha/beta fold hydrolase [Entomomonas asaccharolytica]|uniref:Transporter n=1 Tax=Entomomonas asaccharolytica TaxID=2785331 RepID=A0A974NI64_9GAMM|nr:alpha/beta fold hydrolase [Entomomonas asaccharolytica]QQP87046.1 transporter [Entomomonas asaccharolytica]